MFAFHRHLSGPRFKPWCRCRAPRVKAITNGTIRSTRVRPIMHCGIFCLWIDVPTNRTKIAPCSRPCWSQRVQRIVMNHHPKKPSSTPLLGRHYPWCIDHSPPILKQGFPTAGGATGRRALLRSDPFANCDVLEEISTLEFEARKKVQRSAGSDRLMQQW